MPRDYTDPVRRDTPEAISAQVHEGNQKQAGRQKRQLRAYDATSRFCARETGAAYGPTGRRVGGRLDHDYTVKSQPAKETIGGPYAARRELCVVPAPTGGYLIASL